MKKTISPLTFIKKGISVTIKEILGGDKINYRLTEMGLVHGSKIRVIKNDLDGPLIISVGEGRLVIGKGMALKIMVEEI